MGYNIMNTIRKIEGIINNKIYFGNFMAVTRKKFSLIRKKMYLALIICFLLIFFTYNL